LTAGRDGNILIFDLRTTGFWADSGGMDEQRFARALQGNHAGGYWDKGKINPVMTVRNAHGENCGKKVSAVSFLFLGKGKGKDADVLGFAEERCEECDELVGVEVGSKRDCLWRIGRWVSPSLLKW
jgi:hypothetical protein